MRPFDLSSRANSRGRKGQHPHPSRRKERLFGMTYKMHHYQLIALIQPSPNVGDNFFRRCVDTDSDDFVIRRLFQIGELSGENRFTGEVSVPRSQPFGDERSTSLQIDKSNFPSRFLTATEPRAVVLLQRGARQHSIAVGSNPALDL